MNITDYKSAAKAIGGATTRAYHLTVDRTNRILVETKAFADIAMSAADGFDKKNSELLEEAQKFNYTVKILSDNGCQSAIEGLESGIKWLREYKEELVVKDFYRWYMIGFSCDIYRSEMKIAREEAGLTQQQFAEMFDISLDTVKSWDCGRRKPDKLKEKLILKELKSIKEQ